MQIIKSGERTRNSWVVALYGPPGVGKTTLAALAPNPVLIDLEDGAERVLCDRTPRINTVAEFKDVMRQFVRSEYETAIIDTLDMLEQLVFKDVLESCNWKSIEQPGYGKGYEVARERWVDLLKVFDGCVQRGKNILCTCHDQIRTYTTPDTDSYERYDLKLHKKVSALIMARMDAVLFCQKEMVLVRDRVKEDRLIGKGTGNRVLRTTETPAWIAKNRFNLPDTMPMTGDIYKLFT
jgi:hypothetical protein